VVELKKVIFVLLGILMSTAAVATSMIVGVNEPESIEEVLARPGFLYYTAGKLYFSYGDLDKAKEMFEKTIEIDEYAPAYHNLGVVYYELGEMRNAISNFEEAIEINSGYSKAYYSLGILYFELGEYSEAIRNLGLVVEIEPENPNANFDLGQGYVARYRGEELEGMEDLDDLEQALIYLRRAEELEPGFPNAVNNIEIIEGVIG
jgi:tetratricopeptide (TPR) repeat protein